MTPSSAESTDKYTRESITWVQTWTPTLFSLRTTRPKSFRFTAGQFARLGVEKADGSVAWRAYSMASGPFDEFLEFFSIVVPGGEFTSELSRLKAGDSLLIDKANHGFLTLNRFTPSDHLWLLSTGTGLAPFLSMLWDPATWESFKKIILVHSVRHHAELAYRKTITGFAEHEVFCEVAHKLVYLPVITREPQPNGLHQRITTLIQSGVLERAAGVSFDLDKSRFMLCGNPEMVNQTRGLLKDRGFRTSRQSAPGQIAVENYW